MFRRNNGGQTANLYRLGKPIDELPEDILARGFVLARDTPHAGKRHTPQCRIAACPPHAADRQAVPMPKSGIQNSSREEELYEVSENPQVSSAGAVADDDVDHSPVNETVKGGGGDNQNKRQAWRVATILARAKTPPNNPAAYVRASLPKFLASESDEITNWLSHKALELLSADPMLRLADLADELKMAAISQQLPYTPEVIDAAIKEGSRRQLATHSLESALTIGRGPSARVAHAGGSGRASSDGTLRWHNRRSCIE